MFMILKYSLINFKKFDIFNPNNQNILIGDSAYDSNLISKKLNEKNFGILLAP